MLGGRTALVPSPQRPPWALAEAAFLSACTRCGECVSACPTGLLQTGAGRYPYADFNHGHCTFCGDCSRACAPHAIGADLAARPWDIRISIASSCLTEQGVVCRTCGELCEVAAIRFTPTLGGVSRPQLDAERCTGCGECLAPCPTQAIKMQHQSAPQSQEITA